MVDSDSMSVIEASKSRGDVMPVESSRMNSLTVKKRVLFLLVSLLLGCVVVEGLARLFFPEWAPRTALITKFWQYDPRYGWAHIPGASGPFPDVRYRYSGYD